MQAFKDSEGREWQLAINVAAVKRVRDLAEVDLLVSMGGSVLEQLAEDPVKLCDVLWAIVQPQAALKQVTDEQFGEALAGEVIDHATAAFLTELVAFFPQPRRGLMQKAMAKLDKLKALTTGAAERALDGDLLERVVTEQLAGVEKGLEAELRAKLNQAAPGETST